MVIFHNSEKFFHLQRMTASIPGGEIPLAQYCAEKEFRTNLPEYY